MEKNNIYNFAQGKEKSRKHINKTLPKEKLNTIEEFARTLACAVSVNLGKQCAVSIQRVTKNGSPCIGLLMEHFAFKCDPFVYLDKVFEGYSNGEYSIEACAEFISENFSKIIKDFVTEMRKEKII